MLIDVNDIHYKETYIIVSIWCSNVKFPFASSRTNDTWWLIIYDKNKDKYIYNDDEPDLSHLSARPRSYSPYAHEHEN